MQPTTAYLKVRLQQLQPGLFFLQNFFLSSWMMAWYEMHPSCNITTAGWMRCLNKPVDNIFNVFLSAAYYSWFAIFNSESPQVFQR